MAKFRVERGGGEFVFPSLGLILNDGDIVDLPSDTNVDGLVPVGKSSTKSDVSDSVATDTPVEPTATTEGA